MFWDQVSITVKAGHGGDGHVSFRQEKYVAKGGPDGGDGGQGGNIIVRVNDNLNTLAFFNSRKEFQAEHGLPGQRARRHGATGNDLVLEVPRGTLIYRGESDTLIADLSEKGMGQVMARGGRGGYGNAHFVSSTRQTPRFAERGEPGEEAGLRLELRLVADVGIMGLPSAGKSTLISRITNARPKIADYPFTTLIPNLGVVVVDDERFVICDIPGLIEGAHQGKGLGDEFLRHIQRSKVLVHLIDVNDKDVVKSYKLLNRELQLYDKTLAKKPQLVVLNKIDTIDDEAIELLMKDMRKRLPGLRGKLFAISAVSGKGLDKLVYAMVAAVKKLDRPRKKVTTAEEDREARDYKIFRPHLDQRGKSFEVHVVKPGVYQVAGKRIEQIVVMSDLSNPEALERVYDVLHKMGIERALIRGGAKSGDVVVIGQEEIVFRDR